jgi:tRNA-splicing ligase RtcB
VKPISLDQIRPVREGEFRWRLPRTGAMRTDGLVFADDALFSAIRDDPALVQVCNVATLPGIVGPSLAMPDIHWGYGFPIGGVAAFDAEEGVISPGGVGFDISCGVRLLRTDLAAADFTRGEARQRLADALFASVPSGVGRGSDLRLQRAELVRVLRKGAAWAVDQGLGRTEDLEYLEERGCIAGADPDQVSDRALERGARQLGTLGSGNHFLEVQRVDEIHDPEAARVLGLEAGALCVSIHTGSRGFGYQVCEDHVRSMQQATRKYGIDLPDRQLCCAPLTSPEARSYLGAMSCGVNYALANRQVITHRVREAFEAVTGSVRIGVVYDVCHNVAKLETHRVDGRDRKLWVHRKGATRALPPGHPDLPALYRSVGQPVLVPGDMGRYSYVLCGNAVDVAEHGFASSCHGAGRLMSRKKAKARARGRDLFEEMAQRGVLVRSEGRATVAEEMPEAYKDVAEVVSSTCGAGLARRVARLVPLAVVKG